MKIHTDCRPCLIRQMESTAREAGADEELVRLVSRAAEDALEEGWNDSRTPPEISTDLYRMVGEMVGCDDPYRDKKTKYTEEAMTLLPMVDDMVKRAEDPFTTAVRVAIAGNVIDFGTGVVGPEFDLRGKLDEYLARPFLVEDMEDLRRRVAGARSILYLGDNAGETVFDRPLLSLLPPGRVTYAAKSGAIINDATVEDAHHAGIHHHAEVVGTGARTPGTVIDRCSAGFTEIFEGADLVISKGQGNFETLSEHRREGIIFMLFVVKCSVVARHLDAAEGDMVAMKW